MVFFGIDVKGEKYIHNRQIGINEKTNILVPFDTYPLLLRVVTHHMELFEVFCAIIDFDLWYTVEPLIW